MKLTCFQLLNYYRCRNNLKEEKIRTRCSSKNLISIEMVDLYLVNIR